MNSISILGVKICAVDMTVTLATIAEFVQSGKPHMVVTADASAAVLAQSDAELKEIINSADLVTPDSVGILWAARRFGTPLPERVSGADLVERLCEQAAVLGNRVFLLGAAPGVAEDAAANLYERYPGLQIVGTHHGYFKPEESDEVVRKIRAARPDILFVAMGIPRQEKWIREHIVELQVPVSMGVGGTFDVISGRTKRAPEWIQRHSLEWLHRLVSNPRKIRKCSTLPVFVWMVLQARKG
jgi:N-acetylglucosaminyldiphosphoundecaprenol N-acetyl-beta-D-mannosaminyltransferase